MCVTGVANDADIQPGGLSSWHGKWRSSMDIQPFPGFRNLRTKHCVSGAIQQLYVFHGRLVTEEMLLGLGSGVGFVYWHAKGMLPFYGGRANTGRAKEEGLEKTIGRRSGVRVEEFQTSSANKAEKALLELLKGEEPVMVLLDMGYLPYLDLPPDYHFGHHAVVACGWDEAQGMVLLADRDSAFHPVALDVLRQARGSKYQPFPPRNRWWTFDFSAAREPRPEEILQAIEEVTEGMLNPPIRNLGVQGIRTAARRTLDWPREFSKNELRNASYNAYIFIDAKGGTGGGIFRYMYASFLQQAADRTGLASLAEAGRRMQAVGDSWQQAAEAFHAAAISPDAAELLPAACSIVSRVAEEEQQAWDFLAAVLHAR
jgi:hypothetical protein